MNECSNVSMESKVTQRKTLLIMYYASWYLHLADLNEPTISEAINNNKKKKFELWNMIQSEKGVHNGYVCGILWRAKWINNFSSL